MSPRPLLFEHVLEPGTGKALELRRGQVLRIEQIEGGQCVDFNCFNLHDYKEFMHTGRTRTLYGLNPSEGDFMWSAPPRERPLIYILRDTFKCNDVIFPRCSAYLYETAYGFAQHTNCQDIQAEAQREYGLTPDDVHDSFNLFMHTRVDGNGHPVLLRQTSKPGDYVELLALIDALAVPNICGGDISRTNNFAIKPVRLAIYEATEAELAAVPATAQRPSQRTPADFKVKQIKADRELRRDPSYTPEFVNTPVVYQDVPVTLDDQDYALLQTLKIADIYGDDDGAALRDIVFTWWEENFFGSPAKPAR